MKQTFSDVAAHLGRQRKKYEADLNSSDRAAKNTAKRMIERIDANMDQLFQLQESQKTNAPATGNMSTPPMMEDGGDNPFGLPDDVLDTGLHSPQHSNFNWNNVATAAPMLTSAAGFFTNRKAIRGMQAPPKPVNVALVQLNKNLDVSADRARIARGKRAINKSADQFTGRNVAQAAKTSGFIQGLNADNKLTQQQTNYRRQMENQQAGLDFRRNVLNTQSQNAYNASKNQFENARRTSLSNNVGDFMTKLSMVGKDFQTNALENKKLDIMRNAYAPGLLGRAMNEQPNDVGTGQYDRAFGAQSGGSNFDPAAAGFNNPPSEIDFTHTTPTVGGGMPMNPFMGEQPDASPFGQAMLNSFQANGMPPAQNRVGYPQINKMDSRPFTGQLESGANRALQLPEANVGSRQAHLNTLDSRPFTGQIESGLDRVLQMPNADPVNPTQRLDWKNYQYPFGNHNAGPGRDPRDPSSPVPFEPLTHPNVQHIDWKDQEYPLGNPNAGAGKDPKASTFRGQPPPKPTPNEPVAPYQDLTQVPSTGTSDFYELPIDSNTFKKFRQLEGQEYTMDLDGRVSETGKDCASGACFILGQDAKGVGTELLYSGSYTKERKELNGLSDIATLGDGELVFINTGEKPHEKRADGTLRPGKGIDHVATVVVDKKTGKKFIAEMRGGVGAELTPMDGWVARWSGKLDNVYTAKPK